MESEELVAGTSPKIGLSVLHNYLVLWLWTAGWALPERISLSISVGVSLIGVSLRVFGHGAAIADVSIAAVVDYIDDKAAFTHTELRQKRGDADNALFYLKILG